MFLNANVTREVCIELPDEATPHGDGDVAGKWRSSL